jgi:hypothetical protein
MRKPHKVFAYIQKTTLTTAVATIVSVYMDQTNLCFSTLSQKGNTK